ATFTALYAAMDLKDDLWSSQVRAMSDAQLLAEVTVVPAIVWAALWTLVSVALLALGGFFAVSERRRPARSSTGPSVAAPR
ncbi:MAG: M50 family metallopeptidase, partial [Myxococcaceae bacterium]|nr:M50 family metallopeptidase [Myxococcaceae bacterium]